MNAADTRLHRARDAARHRALAHAVLATSPWLVAAAILAWRAHAAPWSLLLLVAALLGATWHAWRTTRGFGDRWLARKLDAQRGDMEDSADLLFAHGAPTNAVERLQQARLRQRVQSEPAPDLRAPWRTRRLLTGAALACACIVAIVLYPTPPQSTSSVSPTAPERATAVRPPQLVARRIDIRPPAYTGLPARAVDTLAAKVPEGSTLQWTLRFEPMPERADLVFHDGERVILERKGDAWTGSHRLDKPALYRLDLEHPLPPAQAGPHRLDMVIDRPPQLRALQPRRTLTLLAPGQRNWNLEFEASDDHGLAPTARLLITRTVGSGENITAREQVVTLRGQGGATRRRYTHRIDLAALGLVEGDDLIAQLSVSDRRAPEPHTTRSPSYILRWSPEPGIETTDLDGMVKRVMPAYFRSQRQIIIDAEALLAEKPSLPPDRYVQRSDAIGVDQRLLRLRYGQFLGEESEGTPQLMPTNDAQNQHEATLEEEAPATAAARTDLHDDEHGHAGVQRESVFGEEQAVLERFGHTHDLAEAATLLDPDTRELLRAALNEMWQSELHLRQGQPELALPYARRALDFIKQVQQAERIYLPRIGRELPPIDQDRRLSGDRDGLGNRGDLLAEAITADPVIANAWRALAPMPTAESIPPDLDALVRQIDSYDTSETNDTDPLVLIAAIDALRRDPACNACRERLRNLLWPLLAHPPPAMGERKPPGRTGNAYLDALGEEATR